MAKAQNWAIVVGINKYDRITPLKYANRDAEAMAQFFRSSGFDRVFCFADELEIKPDHGQSSFKPGFSNLVTFLHEIATSKKKEPLKSGDNFWFFFAGHGKRIQDYDYLLPQDYNPVLPNHENLAISVNYVRESLLKSGADNVILLLDACRTEGGRNDGLGIGDEQPGAITIFSCERNREAYEIEVLRQGAFTSALLEALQMPGERNCATVERLDLYLRARVPQICAQHQKPRQVPIMLVEPRQKSYLILLPDFATDQDIATLKNQAYKTWAVDKKLDLAEHLWVRVLAASHGLDADAIKALQSIAVQKSTLLHESQPEITVTPIGSLNISRSIATPEIPKPTSSPVNSQPKVSKSRSDRISIVSNLLKALSPQTSGLLMNQAVSASSSSPPYTFTRRKVLYFGLSGLGAGGAITLGLSNFPRPEIVPPGIFSSPIYKNSLEIFSFPTVKLTPKGERVDHEIRRGQQFVSAFDIKMVLIKGGVFKMGSPVTEIDRSNDEGPQHSVTVPDFFMGKTPITQAQWKAVAALPKVKIALKPAPSEFEGDRLPVERVSWEESVEFCDRMNAHTGLEYRLPSEAEWEYACRAGTETPFYFGETISTEVANYDGNATYAKGRKGTYLGKTTVIETYPANPWGLYDMHGNTWEWCADFYHDNYDGAPINGSGWNASNDSVARVLRGGAWFLSASYCRSADRDGNNFSLFSYHKVGLRVVCSSSVSRTLNREGEMKDR